MISNLKSLLRQLRQSKPGQRFVDHYHRNNRQPSKFAGKSWLLVTLGVVMTAGGLVLSLPPGVPGFLLWIPGLALIASQKKTVAVALDRAECAARDLYHKITGKTP